MILLIIEENDYLAGNKMNLTQMITAIKEDPNYSQAGMILCHNGVVRDTSRDGRKVKGLQISVDYEKLHLIITRQKKTKGIIDILVHIFDERPLAVGDDVMYLVVAGDIRDNVITVLQDTLNSIKTTVTRKTEFFV